MQLISRPKRALILEGDYLNKLNYKKYRAYQEEKRHEPNNVGDHSSEGNLKGSKEFPGWH